MTYVSVVSLNITLPCLPVTGRAGHQARPAAAAAARAARAGAAGAGAVRAQHPRQHRVRRQQPRGAHGRDHTGRAEGQRAQLHCQFACCEFLILLLRLSVVGLFAGIENHRLGY